MASVGHIELEFSCVILFYFILFFFDLQYSHASIDHAVCVLLWFGTRWFYPYSSWLPVWHWDCSSATGASNPGEYGQVSYKNTLKTENTITTKQLHNETVCMYHGTYCVIAYSCVILFCFWLFLYVLLIHKLKWLYW